MPCVTNTQVTCYSKIFTTKNSQKTTTNH